MERIKELLTGLRDGMAYAFSWLVICTVIASAVMGNQFVSVQFLLKLFVLCLWGVIAFTVCFRSRKAQKKGFIFSLTLFYVLFIPAEIAMFFLMGIFTTGGNLAAWIAFGVMITVAYLISVMIDVIIMRRRAVDYTQKICEYVKGREN